ncbi:MAG: rhodanese-like domain-containing protein [Lysobacterales bacterium]
MLERLPEFAANNPLLIVMFVALVIALIVTELRHKSRGFASLSPALLTQLINRQDPVLIDVSANADFSRGHIVGARNILPSSLEPENKPLTDWKDNALAVYCKNGMASEQICRKLVKAGYAKVHWLQGGLAAWSAENLPVTRGK